MTLERALFEILSECAHTKVFWEGLLRFRKQRLRTSSFSPSPVSDELSAKMSLFTIRLFNPDSLVLVLSQSTCPTASVNGND